jgi:putative copper export protein
VRAGPQRFLLGLLFLFLAAAFAGLAVASVRDGTQARQLVTALAAGVIAFWLGGLALRSLRRD